MCDKKKKICVVVKLEVETENVNVRTIWVSFVTVTELTVKTKKSLNFMSASLG